MSSDPSAFRRHLYPRDHPRLATVRGLDPYAYRDRAREEGFTGRLIAGWRPLYGQRYRGISETGEVHPELHRFEPPRPGEHAPVADMVSAADELLALLTPEERARLCHEVDAPEWQTWSNPEFLQFDTGLRLEFQRLDVVSAVLKLVSVSLGRPAYRMVRDAMLVNEFLGETVGLETLLNDLSYNVALYGRPDDQAPWGWQLFGHHVAVHCLVVRGRMVVSPVFLGAEPHVIDIGPHAGRTLFARRTELARAVMRALEPSQRSVATVYANLVDPAMPPGRLHPGDERHLGGAFQDNRMVPTEGLRVSDMPVEAQELVLDLAADFVLMPDGPRRARLREIRERLAETWFCWIGGHGWNDVFYVRVQSPVFLAELDHHCGVFLTNTEPAPFHVHTVLRTPHGNDYGRAYVDAYADQYAAGAAQQEHR